MFLKLQESLISEEKIVVGLSTSISEAEQQLGILEETLAVQRLAVLEAEDELRRTDTEIQNQMTRRTNADSYREEFVRRLEGIKVAKEKALKRITGLQESRGNVQVEQDRIASSRESFTVKLQHLQNEWEASRARENQLELSVARNEVEIQGLKDKQLNLNTNVGENGVKISGGQRQRIAIARALYKKKQVIILDEPTSALDKATENQIIQTILNLKKKHTLIISSHKSSIIDICDKVYEIKNKELKEKV